MTTIPASPLTASGPSLSRLSFRSAWRALWAIAHREWLIFRRYPSWIFALLIWPAIFPAMYILSARALAGPDGSGLKVFLYNAGTANFLGYIIVGTTVWMWQNIVLWDVGFALRQEQWRGTLESNWVSPTNRFSFLVGNSLTQLVSVMLFILVSYLEFTLFFGVRFAGSPALALLVMLFAIPSIYGLGFAFASLVIAAKEAQNFVFLVRGIVMIFCGITFPLAVLPSWMQGVALWLPQTHIIAAMRMALLTDAGLAGLRSELIILTFFGVFWLAVGYALFVWMDRRARRTGVIGQY
jgi:ABC-2 type transport system permease protein